MDFSISDKVIEWMFDESVPHTRIELRGEKNIYTIVEIENNFQKLISFDEKKKKSLREQRNVTNKRMNSINVRFAEALLI